MSDVLAAREERFQAIEEFLNMLAAAENSARAYGRFTLEHGRAWETAPYPLDLPRMQIKQCFGNAQKLLMRGRKDLTYVEGYACSGSLSINMPILHAWLVDSEGRVVDPTWDNDPKSAYFGVPFEREYVIKIAKASKAACSLIDNFEMRWPLLMNPDEATEAVKKAPSFAPDLHENSMPSP